MTLKAFGVPAWNSIRGIKFVMLDGYSGVPVLVQHSAVDHVERAEAGGASYLRRFGAHRGLFERIASRKHQRGEFDELGLVVVPVAGLKAF